MRLKTAFEKIVKLDGNADFTGIVYLGIAVWPILRQCLWKNLNSAQIYNKTKYEKSGLILFHKLKLLLLNLKYFEWKKVKKNYNVTSIFISNPVHLQKLKNEESFDKIVDPLIYLLNPNINYEKFYISPFSFENKLSVSGKILLPLSIKKFSLPKNIREQIKHISTLSGIDDDKLLHDFNISLGIFFKWHSYGEKFFESRPNLKRLYVVGWYSPAIMGLVSAAKTRGIVTIDLQHGKQGLYQAMYNGWNQLKINNGYKQMPDYFWTWGEPTKMHILGGDSRKKHIPFVGGYPWIAYYLKYEASQKIKQKDNKTILFTMQPAQGENIEPIPDFILKLLKKENIDFSIIFRRHPNDDNGEKYYYRRLAKIPKRFHIFDNCSDNLYDKLNSVTHHITAYSSCCYEAKIFGVDTLLFGTDALDIYHEEIKNDVFKWTIGEAEDVLKWLESNKRKTKVELKSKEYIISSLQKASRYLNEPNILN